MEQPIYTTLKVNNEIELCKLSDLECKQLIEKQLLKERISYYIRWSKPSFFSRKKSTFTICVNENVRDDAENVVRAVCDEMGCPVKFLMRRSPNQYL